MSRIPGPPFQMESCAIDFAISSLVNFGIVYMTQPVRLGVLKGLSLR